MRRTVAALMGVVFLACGSALAYHSCAEFLRDQTVSIDGEVEAFLYGNPHVILKVRAQDAHTYTAVWNSSTQLGRAGIISTTLKVGDRVIVRGSPARDMPVHELSLIKEVRRPIDGWHWPQWRSAATRHTDV